MDFEDRLLFRDKTDIAEAAMARHELSGSELSGSQRIETICCCLIDIRKHEKWNFGTALGVQGRCVFWLTQKW